MVFIAAVLFAAAIQPLEVDAPAASDSLPSASAVVEEQVPPDSATAGADSLPFEARPAEQKEPQALGPPGADILYLKDGTVLAGRVLGMRGKSITMFVASKHPATPGHVVQVDKSLLSARGRVVPSEGTRWRAVGIRAPRFGRFTEGIRVPSYPQVCPEIGIAYLRVDLSEIEKGIQHLYDTDATLRPHRLRVESFEEDMIGFPMGIAVRMSPHVAVGLTGVYLRSGPVKGLAIGELRVRPRGAHWPWLGLGMSWRRIEVRTSQNVKVQSGSSTVWYEGATWKSSTSSPTLGIRFDTASHTADGVTFAFYWFAAPHVHTTLRSEWSGCSPPRGEFPESVRMGLTVFTVGLQFN